MKISDVDINKIKRLICSINQRPNNVVPLKKSIESMLNTLAVKKFNFSDSAENANIFQIDCIVRSSCEEFSQVMNIRS
jgi:hypothetical protein